MVIGNIINIINKIYVFLQALPKFFLNTNTHTLMINLTVLLFFTTSFTQDSKFFVENLFLDKRLPCLTELELNHWRKLNEIEKIGKKD